MVELGITITADRLPELGAEFRKELGDLMMDAALEIATKAKESIIESGHTGRIYKRGQKGEHQASAAGEPPANDEGNLKASIEARQVDELTAEVTVGAAYGADLEFGTVKMAARPFLGPAIAAVEPELQKDAAEVLERGLRK